MMFAHPLRLNVKVSATERNFTGGCYTAVGADGRLREEYELGPLTPLCVWHTQSDMWLSPKRGLKNESDFKGEVETLKTCRLMVVASPHESQH